MIARVRGSSTGEAFHAFHAKERAVTRAMSQRSLSRPCERGRGRRGKARSPRPERGLRRRIFRVADLVQVEWRPNAELALKRSSVRYDSPGQ